MALFIESGARYEYTYHAFIDHKEIYIDLLTERSQVLTNGSGGLNCWQQGQCRNIETSMTYTKCAVDTKHISDLYAAV
jgi:hypothetical protein